MAVVNRCAVGIYPSQKLLDWARQLELDVDVAGASEPCLYLGPPEKVSSSPIPTKWSRQADL